MPKLAPKKKVAAKRTPAPKAAAPVAAPKAAVAGKAANASQSAAFKVLKSKATAKSKVSAARRTKPVVAKPKGTKTVAAKPKGAKPAAAGAEQEPLVHCVDFAVAKGSLPGLPALAPIARGFMAAGSYIACAPPHLIAVPPFVSVRVVDEQGSYLPQPYSEYGTADVAEAAILFVGGAGALSAVQACPRLTTSALMMCGDGLNHKVLKGVPHAKELLKHWKGRRSLSGM